MSTCSCAARIALAVLFLAAAQSQQLSVLLDPKNPEMTRQAPPSFKVLLDSSKGPITLEIERGWAPHGVDRFYNLVRHGYYDGAKFFRIRAGFWAQFGIAGDPRIATAWRNATIPDDPRRLSNVRGTIAYAFRDPDGRTTQVFINLRDNSATHDTEPFVPFGRVIEGMDVVDALYSEYGEKSGGGIRAGRQDRLFGDGNAYLDREFPRLDYIRRATIVR
jgi:cyclophilin family peptidyl-prolyl cis-trans isomerase